MEGASDALDRSGGAGTAWLAGLVWAFRLAIPYLCMQWFGAEPQSAALCKLATGFVVFFLVALSTLGAASQPWRDVLEPSSVRWVLAYLLFAALSLGWSETASLPASFAYWCGTATDLASALLILRTSDSTQLARAVLRGWIAGACAIALLAWGMPAEYDLRLGDENFFNANSICNVCALGVFFTQYLQRHGERRPVLVTLLLCLTVVRSLSKTTIAAFCFAQLFLVLRDRSMTRRTKLWLVAGAALSLLLFWSLFQAYYDFYTSYGNQAETLTGRTAIWSYVADALAERPWFGHGFDSMWEAVPVFGTFEARHAENELLEQLYSYGATGLVLLCGVYGGLWRDARRYADPATKVFLTSILLFVLVRGLAEAEPFDLLLPLWNVALLALLAKQDGRTGPDRSAASCATSAALLAEKLALG
jgi:exopolysaccharide production protein ExoQ